MSCRSRCGTRWSTSSCHDEQEPPIRTCPILSIPVQSIPVQPTPPAPWGSRRDGADLRCRLVSLGALGGASEPARRPAILWTQQHHRPREPSGSRGTPPWRVPLMARDYGQMARVHRSGRCDHATVSVPFSALRVHLTPDGEVEVLGTVHAYLASWLTRAETGAAPKPATWPTAPYLYTAAALRVRTLPEDAERVATTLAEILRRPGMTRAVQTRPREGTGPRTGEACWLPCSGSPGSRRVNQVGTQRRGLP